MSPEQARGEEVDARTDSGRSAAFLRDADGTPRIRGAYCGRQHRQGSRGGTGLDRVAPRCVFRRRRITAALSSPNPRQRIEDMPRVRALLDLASAPRLTKHVRIALAGITVVAVTVSALVGYSWWNAPAPAPTDASAWQQLTNFADSATQPALSADGRMLTFIRGEDTFATPGQVYLKNAHQTTDGVDARSTGQDGSGILAGRQSHRLHGHRRRPGHGRRLGYLGRPRCPR